MRCFEVRSLAVSAGSRVLLSGLDLTLRPGQRVALVGPSGAGKTVLLRTLACLVDAGAGELLLDGRTPSEIGYPRWRRQVTYVAQRPVLLPGVAAESLRRPFTYRTATEPYPEERAFAWLERLAVLDALEQPTAQLSEGQRQRVALVRALLIQPPVLLLDEPTSALDPETAKAAEALVTEQTERGSAALIVTHTPAQAERFCQRTIDIREYGSA